MYFCLIQKRLVLDDWFKSAQLYLEGLMYMDTEWGRVALVIVRVLNQPLPLHPNLIKQESAGRLEVIHMTSLTWQDHDPPILDLLKALQSSSRVFNGQCCPSASTSTNGVECLFSTMLCHGRPHHRVRKGICGRR